MHWNLKHSYILITESDCQIKIKYFGLALKLELGEKEKKHYVECKIIYLLKS